MRYYFTVYFFLLVFFSSCGGENIGNQMLEQVVERDNLSGISRGEELFNSKCLICHIKNKPGGKFVKDLSAPPMTRVIFHVKQAFTDTSTGVFRSDEAISFIQDYVIYPNEKKAICSPSRIKAFGLMPSLKGSVSGDELEDIAVYMIEDFPLEELMNGQGGEK